MTENEARYILRMIDAFKNNILFHDATDKDNEELTRMRERYREAGRWTAGSETALVEFIMRVEKFGVPGGEYLITPPARVDLYLQQTEVPKIERGPDHLAAQPTK